MNNSGLYLLTKHKSTSLSLTFTLTAVAEHSIVSMSVTPPCKIFNPSYQTKGESGIPGRNSGILHFTVGQTMLISYSFYSRRCLNAYTLEAKQRVSVVKVSGCVHSIMFERTVKTIGYKSNLICTTT